MELHDPALVVSVFFAEDDPGAGRLWEAVREVPPGGPSAVRRWRVLVDGAAVVQVAMQRAGAWETVVWQDLAQEMAAWLGQSWDFPPGRPWGASRFYLGAVVAGVYEERSLLGQGLALPEEPPRQVVHLPTGRLWLVSPPAVVEREPVIASYAWFHPPAPEARQQVERLLWEDNSPLLRVELYLHRALRQLRQYGREERASFWAALEKLEAVVPACLDRPDDRQVAERLRGAARVVMQGLARLSRLHNLLRSSAHLYRQIGSELRQERGGLFSWYEERQKEAMIQWGYDLERADRAIALTRTALLARSRRPKARKIVGRPSWSWVRHLMGAAILALCLVDESWKVVLVRAGVVLLLLLAAWAWSWHRRYQKKRKVAE